MKVKYLLTALALPAMFAACSQEDIVTDVQNQPVKLLGEVAGDVDFTIAPTSRLAWGTTGDAAWEAEDGFSLFWVGTNPNSDTALTGKINALYKKASGEDKFTSQNIVYVGNHLIVYPADYAHMGEETIEVSVGANQDGSVALGKRSIWTTDSLLTIAKPVAQEEDEVPGVIYAGGYGEAVPASLEALSSNLVLNLGFKMGNATNINVKKVVLRADNGNSTPAPVKVFATGGILKAEALSGTYNRNVVFESPVDSIHSEVALTVNETVSTSDTTCTVQFALLPNTTTITTGTKYYIDVYTNYGVVTIGKAKYVTAKSGKINCDNVAAGTEAGKEAAGYDADLDLTAELNLMAVEYDEDYLYRTTESTKASKVEAYGKRVTLNVTVDMADADIDNMEVATSADLVAAYATYDLLEKDKEEDFVTFKLNSQKPFELTPEAVTAILGNTAVTLDNIGNDTIKLTGAHTSIPALQYVNKDKSVVELFNQMGNTPLVLGEEGTWAIDVDNAASANVWGKIINNGTLTISESNTTNKTAKKLSSNIENQDSVVVSGEVEIPVIYVQKAGATNILANSYLKAQTSAVYMDIDGGKVYVDGYWSVEGGSITNKAEVIVNGILNTTSGSFTNVGTIKLAKADAYAIISDNAIGVTNGSIESYARNSQAKVTNPDTQGYIKWNCDVTEFTGASDDTFNYAILSGNLTVKSQGTLKHVEIARGKQVSLKEEIEVPDKSRSAADGKLDLGLVKVNENATLIVPTGSEITYKNFVNSGRKELISGSFTDSGNTVADLIAYNRNVTLENGESVITIPAGYNGKIDLNGQVVGYIENYGDVEITNGTIGNSDGQAVVSHSGSLTLNDVKVTGGDFVIDLYGGSATIKNSTVTSTSNATGKYAIGAEDCDLTIESVNFNGSGTGSVSAWYSTVSLKGTTAAPMTLSTGDSAYGFHVWSSVLNYDNNVNFESCYIQTRSETNDDIQSASVINGAVFTNENKTNDFGYWWSENAKTSLEALIETKKATSAE